MKIGGFGVYLTILELDSSRKNTQGVKQELCKVSFIYMLTSFLLFIAHKKKKKKIHIDPTLDIDLFILYLFGFSI